MSRSKGHTLVQASGTVLALIALFYVVERLRANSAWFDKWHFTIQTATIISCGSIFYAGSCFFLSLAWRRLLIWFGQFGISIKACHSIYARTQIAKYLPGNVFHFAGRHVMGRQFGLGHGPMAGAAFCEVVGLLGASSTIALLGVIVYGTDRVKGSALATAAIFFAMLCTPLVMKLAIPRIPFLKGWTLPERNIAQTMISLTPVFLLYLAFFAAAGTILSWLASVVALVSGIQSAGAIMAAFAASWIAGYLIPGAPAGFGVRDALLVLMLETTIAEPQSLMIALNFRIITLLGDVLFFLSSFIFAGGDVGKGQPEIGETGL